MPVFCPEYRAQSECCAPSFPSVFLSSSHLPRRAVLPLRPSCGLSAACLPRNICSISFFRAKFNLFAGSAYISFFRGATRYAYRDRRCSSGCNCTFDAQTECTGSKEKSALFSKGKLKIGISFGELSKSPDNRFSKLPCRFKPQAPFSPCTGNQYRFHPRICRRARTRPSAFSIFRISKPLSRFFPLYRRFSFLHIGETLSNL